MAACTQNHFKRNQRQLACDIRFHNDNSAASSIPIMTAQLRGRTIPYAKLNDSLISLTSTSATPTPTPNVMTQTQDARLKYISDLEQISFDNIGEKIMDKPITLPFQEVIGISSYIDGRRNDQFCTVKGNHQRSQELAGPSERLISGDTLKA